MLPRWPDESLERSFGVPPMSEIRTLNDSHRTRVSTRASFLGLPDREPLRINQLSLDVIVDVEIHRGRKVSRDRQSDGSAGLPELAGQRHVLLPWTCQGLRRYRPSLCHGVGSCTLRSASALGVSPKDEIRFGEIRTRRIASGKRDLRDLSPHARPGGPALSLFDLSPLSSSASSHPA